MSRSADLFEKTSEDTKSANMPLAARMRPRSLEEIVGQDKILGPGKLLRRAIEADRLNSIILYGPAGCGKTSLAEVIARVTKRMFERTSGVVANVAILRDILERSRNRRDNAAGLEQDGSQFRGTILFVDEIHRFNKAQQDVLLPYVEDGTVTLVGATTHNPMFFINSPLTSRSLVFELDPLSEDAIATLLRSALIDERGLASLNVRMDEDAVRHLARVCEGDARRALNALEIAALSTDRGPDGAKLLNMAIVEDSIQKKTVNYDHDEDGHYDTISAFIKSVRGSDPHAAVYWLAKMLYAGEDPRFIVRRLVILASEDIGNADPRGLTLAVAAMEAVEFVGMPEARIILAQATTYLATAPKSNAAYLAVDKALEDVKNGRVLEVPERLKNVKLRTAGDDAEKKDDQYVYPHDYQGHFVNQEYVPTTTLYYNPTEQGYEAIIGKRMAAWDPARRQCSGKEDQNVRKN
jgi:putative ATPase